MPRHGDLAVDRVRVVKAVVRQGRELSFGRSVRASPTRSPPGLPPFAGRRDLARAIDRCERASLRVPRRVEPQVRERQQREIERKKWAAAAWGRHPATGSPMHLEAQTARRNSGIDRAGGGIAMRARLAAGRRGGDRCGGLHRRWHRAAKSEIGIGFGKITTLLRDRARSQRRCRRWQRCRRRPVAAWHGFGRGRRHGQLRETASWLARKTRGSWQRVRPYRAVDRDTPMDWAPAACDRIEGFSSLGRSHHAVGNAVDKTTRTLDQSSPVDCWICASNVSCAPFEEDVESSGSTRRYAGFHEALETRYSSDNGALSVTPSGQWSESTSILRSENRCRCACTRANRDECRSIAPCKIAAASRCFVRGR